MDIFVYANWQGMGSPVHMGILSANSTRGKEIFSFQYDPAWLKSPHCMQLDPDLGLYAGNQYLRDEKHNFGMFLDSSPDRWGRLLMKRREAILARSSDRKERTLRESDFLLGVFDEHRMGALRFKTDPYGPFLDDNRNYATPPWTSLRELEQASLRLEEDHITDDPEYLHWLNMLITPGSSLGGARPKASVLDNDGALWIAKFPSRHDHENTGAWEMVANQMAQASGIRVAEARIQRFNSRHHTYLTKRFDRSANGGRIHFASAMTLLGYTDGADYNDGISYLELAEFIMRHGADVKADLHELFRRILFSIAVSNTDDHLRNHGFILTTSGWRLSPAYDINPNPYGTGLKLNISETDNALDFDLALEVAPYFRLEASEAKKIVDTIKHVVSGWRTFATKAAIPSSEQELMASAFHD